MNDDLMLEYLLDEATMTPEEERLLRSQAQIDQLRNQASQPLKGGMAGRVYVGPSWAQGLSQLGNAWGARKGQERLDEKYNELNANRVSNVKRLRDLMAGNRSAPVSQSITEQPPEDDWMQRWLYGSGRRR